MAKKFEGLDAMIQPTTETTEEGKSQKEKPEYINSNIPMLKEQHQKLRIVAMIEGKTLKELLPQIIQEYLDTKKINL